MQNKLTNNVHIESVLYVLLWLLQTYGYVYFDNDSDEDIIELENHLISTNVPFKKGDSNRKYITTNL
jgi:hypothetical protein